MRTILPALALLALLPCLPACLQSSDAVTLEADGTGTIKSTYVIDLKKSRELVDTASLFMPDLVGEDALKVNPTAPNWFRKFAGQVEGYTISKANEVTQGDVRTSTIEATFTSLAAAAKGGAFFSSKVRLDQDEEKRWVLTFKDSLADAEGIAEGIDLKAILPGFEAQLGTLKIVRTITLPTQIVESNGKIAEDGRTVEFTVDFARIIDGSDLEMRVVFAAAEGMDLQAFSHTPNTDILIERFSTEAPKDLPVITPAHEGDGEAQGEGSTEAESPDAPEGDAPPAGDSRGG